MSKEIINVTETAEVVSGSEEKTGMVALPGGELVSEKEASDLADELVVNPVIKLNKPYIFEKKEYTEIDMSGLDELTAQDLLKIEKMYARTNRESVMPEITGEYALFVAATVTKKPVEFFYGLPAKVLIKIKNRVMGFFFGAE